MNNLTSEQWSYIAGIIDWNGSISINTLRGNEFNVNFYLSNSDEQFIDLLNKLLPGGSKTYRKKTEGYGYKSIFCILTFKARVFKDIIPNILPHIQIRKKHIEICEKFCRTLVPIGGTGGRKKYLTDEIKELRKLLYLELKELNKKIPIKPKE